jgi:hypothetical protein
MFLHFTQLRLVRSQNAPIGHTNFFSIYLTHDVQIWKEQSLATSVEMLTNSLLATIPELFTWFK